MLNLIFQLFFEICMPGDEYWYCCLLMSGGIITSLGEASGTYTHVCMVRVYEYVISTMFPDETKQKGLSMALCNVLQCTLINVITCCNVRCISCIQRHSGLFLSS